MLLKCRTNNLSVLATRHREQHQPQTCLCLWSLAVHSNYLANVQMLKSQFIFSIYFGQTSWLWHRTAASFRFGTKPKRNKQSWTKKYKARAKNSNQFYVSVWTLPSLDATQDLQATQFSRNLRAALTFKQHYGTQLKHVPHWWLLRAAVLMVEWLATRIPYIIQYGEMLWHYQTWTCYILYLPYWATATP